MCDPDPTGVPQPEPLTEVMGPLKLQSEVCGCRLCNNHPLSQQDLADASHTTRLRPRMQTMPQSPCLLLLVDQSPAEARLALQTLALANKGVIRSLGAEHGSYEHLCGQGSVPLIRIRAAGCNNPENRMSEDQV